MKTLPTLEEVNKANLEVAAIIINKITKNHFSPAIQCPVCKKGKMGQVGLLIKDMILDAVICSNCFVIGAKCAAYKGEKSCNCQKVAN